MGFGGGWRAKREGRGGGGVMRYVREDLGEGGVEVRELMGRLVGFGLGASESSGEVAGELHWVVEADRSMGESAMSVSLSTVSRNVEKASLKAGLADDLVRRGVWVG